jgi:hypothetical protein
VQAPKVFVAFPAFGFVVPSGSLGVFVRAVFIDREFALASEKEVHDMRDEFY